MTRESKRGSGKPIAFKAAICTAFMGSASLLLTLLTMQEFQMPLLDLDAAGIQLPNIMALGGLIAVLGLHLSDHHHLALTTTTAILAIFTFIVYLPALTHGAGCMNGMVFIFSTVFSIGFPIVYCVFWLLYWLIRKDSPSKPPHPTA